MDSFCSKTETTPKKKGKEGRVWDLGGSNKDAASLDVFNTSEDKDKVTVAASEVGDLSCFLTSRI